jgi:hypothetical protein
MSSVPGTIQEAVERLYRVVADLSLLSKKTGYVESNTIGSRASVAPSADLKKQVNSNLVATLNSLSGELETDCARMHESLDNIDKEFGTLFKEAVAVGPITVGRITPRRTSRK